MKINLPIEDSELKKYVLLVYILQALGFVTGGFTAVIAVIINYIKVDDAKGSAYETHFRWQIRTFWYGLLWVVLGSLTWFIIGWLVLAVVSFWLIYRIAKGWIYVVDGKPMYQ